jgi:hypothetical protein
LADVMAVAIVSFPAQEIRRVQHLPSFLKPGRSEATLSAALVLTTNTALAMHGTPT